MRAIKVCASVVAAIVLALSATSVAAADGTQASASCGSNPDQWAGTFRGVLHTSQGSDRNFRAVVREGGPNVLIDTYVNGGLADGKPYQDLTTLEDGDTLHWRATDPVWDSNTHYWATALTCDSNGVTSAHLDVTIFWLSWIIYDGTITRTA